jgi:hypothetical protein
MQENGPSSTSTRRPRRRGQVQGAIQPTPRFAGSAGIRAAARRLCHHAADRIQRHPDIYAQATREQQSLITQGRIALGFTPAFVRLALGVPDRVTEQTTPKGTETVWHYLEPGYAYGGYGPGYWGGYGGSPFWGGPYWGGPYWGPYFGGAYVVNPPYRDRDRVRVVFKDGRVASFNRVVKED